MTEIEALIKSMSKDGKSPRAISTELYERGLKNNAGKFLTSDMVEGFLRHASETGKPPAVLPAGGDPRNEPHSEYSKEGAAIGGPARYRPPTLREWPSGVDYGGDNEYPDAPPYNYTDKARYAFTPLRGGSSASQAAMEGS